MRGTGVGGHRAAAPRRSAAASCGFPARPYLAGRHALVVSSAALAGELRDAAQLVARVAAGRSLSGGPPRPALLDLTHGTLRRYGRVQALVRELSRRGRPDPLLEALLWCALYALESSRYADYTVVDQAV